MSMMTLVQRYALLAVIALPLGLAACEDDEGAIEQTGEEVGEAIEEGGDALQEGADEAAEELDD